MYTEEEPDQLFSLPPIRDEWRTLFDMFDPEGFGEIPLDDFEVALDSREFITNISPGKIIILKVTIDYRWAFQIMLLLYAPQCLICKTSPRTTS